MAVSVFGYWLCSLILVCFVSSANGAKIEKLELHYHKHKEQEYGRGIVQNDIASSLQSTQKIVKRSASKTVDIAMFTDSSPPGKAFSVYVDDTLTRLIVEVQVERSNPVMALSKPSGKSGPHPKINGTASAGTVTATIDVVITAADCGIWKLNKLDANKWNVHVKGETPLDFSYQFLEGGLVKIPVKGDPVQGKSYTTEIKVQEFAKVKKLDMILEFVTEKSAPVNMIPPTDKGNGAFEVASLKVLETDFMIGIQGRDTSGNFFRRIKVIKPIALILSVPSFNGVKLYENTELDILFSVKNMLSTSQDVDVRIQDDQGFAKAPKIISENLTPGQNYTGKFVIRAGLLGTTTTVTITAKPYLGHGKISQGPSEVRQFTVESNKTTTTMSSITTASTVPTTSTTSSTSKTNNPSGKTASSIQSALVPSKTTSDIKSVKPLSTTSSKSPAAAAVSTVTGSGASSIHRSSNVPISTPSTVKHAAAGGVTAPLVAASKATENPPTAAPAEENEGSFNKGEIFGAAVVSGVSAGVLIGIAALVTMGLVFKHSINKRKVEPEKKKKVNRTLSEHNESAWS